MQFETKKTHQIKSKCMANRKYGEDNHKNWLHTRKYE